MDLTHPDKRRERGMATVELAIILMVLMFLVFGVMEFGWMFLRMQEVSNAARAGARVAIRPDSTNGDVETVVNNLLSQANITGASVSVSLEDISEAELGDPVTVTVAVDYASVGLLGVPLLSEWLPSTLTATATMAKETP